MPRFFFFSKSQWVILCTAAILFICQDALAQIHTLSTTPSITNPDSGQKINSSAVTFQWSSGSGVTEYYLGVGTSAASVANSPWGNIYGGSTGMATSKAVSGIPLNGNPLYVRLWWKIGGAWKYKDSVFQTTVQNPPPPQTTPALTTPAPGQTISASTVTFQWSSGSGVTEYYLGVGNTSASVTRSPWGDIFRGSVGTATTKTVSNIPLNGNPLYVRLWWKIGGVWKYADYQFQRQSQPSTACLTTFNDLQNTLRSGHDAVLCPNAVIPVTTYLTFYKNGQKIYTQGFPTGTTRAKLVIANKNVLGVIRTDVPETKGFQDIQIKNLMIDGNRKTYGVVKCAGNNDCAGPISLFNTVNATIDRVEIFDTRGWTLLYSGGPQCSKTKITNSVLHSAGQLKPQEWADGISLSCANSSVENNTITNVTDGGIVIFGSPGSIIRNNTIRALDRPMLLGIGLTDYAPFNGNYSGVVVENNRLEGTSSGFLFVGIAAGNRLWFGDTHGASYNFGAKVHNNTITGEVVALPVAVSGTRDFTLTSNTTRSNGIYNDSAYNPGLAYSNNSGQTFVSKQSLHSVPTRQMFLYNNYMEILNRRPDVAGMNFYFFERTAASCSKTSLSSITKDFLYSNEGQAILKQKTPETLVTNLYRVILNREPDQGGLTFYANRIRNAGNKLDETLRITDELYDSAEFRDKRLPEICQVGAEKTLREQIKNDKTFPAVTHQAKQLMQTGFNAGNTYVETWIRDFNTFIELALETRLPSDVKENLRVFFRLQGEDGNIIDAFLPKGKETQQYKYVYSPLEPRFAGFKNTVETDQESSLIQAVFKYVSHTGDINFLSERIGNLTVAQRLSLAVDFLMTRKYTPIYGLLWGATTADWGDVQPEDNPGVLLTEKSHLAVDVYDNAMFLIALKNLAQLLPDQQQKFLNIHNTISTNTMRHLWDPTHQKFIPHRYLKNSPFPPHFNENTIYQHGSTAVAIEAGLLNRDQIYTALQKMRENVRLAKASSIGLTLYPAYPNGYFLNPQMHPYNYQNGGDWTWFGARMIQQLIKNGFVAEAYQDIQSMTQRVVTHNGFFEWYTLDNRPMGSAEFRGTAGVLYQTIKMFQAWANNS